MTQVPFVRFIQLMLTKCVLLLTLMFLMFLKHFYISEVLHL